MLIMPMCFCSGFVIATTSELSGVNSTDDYVTHPSVTMVGDFCVVQYVTCSEPVRGFLGRYLRRRLIIAQSHPAAASAGCGPESSQLARVVDWLPSVWHKVNKFLHALSHSQPQQLDITIGNSLLVVTVP